MHVCVYIYIYALCMYIYIYKYIYIYIHGTWYRGPAEPGAQRQQAHQRAAPLLEVRPHVPLRDRAVLRAPRLLPEVIGKDGDPLIRDPLLLSLLSIIQATLSLIDSYISLLSLTKATFQRASEWGSLSFPMARQTILHEDTANANLYVINRGHATLSRGGYLIHLFSPGGHYGDHIL